RDAGPAASPRTSAAGAGSRSPTGPPCPASPSGREPAGDAPVILEPVDGAERGQGERTRADAARRADHRGGVDRVDLLHDLRRIERAVEQEHVMRLLLGAARRALEPHEQAGLELRPGALDLLGLEP